jgi:hypothetical protein
LIEPTRSNPEPPAAAPIGHAKELSQISSTPRGETMAYPGHDLKFSAQTPAEERLCDWTAVFNCPGREDSYFEESLGLLRSIKNRHRDVIDKLKLYLQHAKGELLRCEISAEIERREALIRTMEKKAQKKSEKAEKKNARTTNR